MATLLLVCVSLSPALPNGIGLDPKTGSISGMHAPRDPREMLAVKTGDEGSVEKLVFVVTATNAGMHTHTAFNMNLKTKHCKSSSYWLWIVLLVVALCLCLFFVWSQQQKVEPPRYYALQVAPAPAKPSYDPNFWWFLKGALVPKGQSNKFANGADNGQVGAKTTFLGAAGLPLTWATPEGGWHTVIALNKRYPTDKNKDGGPLGLTYEKLKFQDQLTITAEHDGHGKELGIQVGWTLVGINYRDITQESFGEADRLLVENVDNLPFAMPMQWTSRCAETKTVYAYHRPLGLTYQTSELPIKITKDSRSHGSHIGIKVGWALQAVNYIDVTQMTDVQEVSKILQEEVTKLPVR